MVGVGGSVRVGVGVMVGVSEGVGDSAKVVVADTVGVADRVGVVVVVAVSVGKDVADAIGVAVTAAVEVSAFVAAASELGPGVWLVDVQADSKITNKRNHRVLYTVKALSRSK